MNNTGVFFSIAFASVTLLGCGQGLLMDMDRPLTDPFSDNPAVECFVAERTVSLSWDEDSGADEYILYGAEDTGGDPITWIEVYRGLSTNAVDTSLAADERRIYTLVKVRGSLIFEPDSLALGVGSDILEDGSEPNDSRDDAVELTHTISANMQYYRSDIYADYGSAAYEDYDWYYVTVPPLRQATMTIDQIGLEGGTFGIDVFDETSGDVDVSSTVPFTLTNETTSTRVIRFRLSPNPEGFVTTGSAGGKTISYTITLDSISAIPTE